MSNEEYIEEMFYNAYRSGVIDKFRLKILKKKNKHPNKQQSEIIENVYIKMIKNERIKETNLLKL